MTYDGRGVTNKTKLLRHLWTTPYKYKMYPLRGKLAEEPFMLAAAVRMDIVGANVAVGGRVVEVDVHLAVVEEDKDEDEDGEEEDVDHDDPIDPTTSEPLLRSNPFLLATVPKS